MDDAEKERISIDVLSSKLAAVTVECEQWKKAYQGLVKGVRESQRVLNDAVEAAAANRWE